MKRPISIGNQDFEFLRKNDCFYIDKTDFIRQWWEGKDYTTLITRPRRFGKTLNLSMMNCFFSNKYEGRGDLFEGLSIWEEEEYRQIQGTWPVICLSFADIKDETGLSARLGIQEVIRETFRNFEYLEKNAILSDEEKTYMKNIREGAVPSEVYTHAFKRLSAILYKVYGKKAIIILDEYDTPMQEAWMHGYWDEMAGFMRSLFNSTFKTNPYMERAIMTGITRVTKESIFSDLNHLNVVTTTTKQYETCFGFTQEEVTKALREFGLEGEQERVKFWYDGFTFGQVTDIYNPWSIISFLKKGEYDTHWSSTSRNGLVDQLIREGSKEIKLAFEELIKGNTIICCIDEHVIFEKLKRNSNALWSLLVATGYLKIVSYRKYGNGNPGVEPEYQLAITNYETLKMFKSMVYGWFEYVDSRYDDFIQSLLSGDLEMMNLTMNHICFNTFGYFDTKGGDLKEPERFYHGFVLGLLVKLEKKYILTSNRESGYGRYDICLKPKNIHEPAFILEFKVRNPKKEEDLEATVTAALNQIEEKRYEAALMAEDIPKENIRKYGFAFEGKDVLIGKL